MRTIKGTKTAWIDILKPTEQDITKLKKLHPFHPVILKELLEPSARARIDNHDKYLFISFHIPIYDPQMKTSRRAEVDFLITKHAVVTAHYEHLKQIDSLFEKISTNEAFRKEVLSGDSLLAVYHLFEEMINFSLRQLRHVEERVSFIAQEIFNNKEEALLREISYIKRDILDYRLITQPQEEFFARMVLIGEQFWGKKSYVYLNDLQNDILPVHTNIRNYFEVIESLENTNAQLLGAQTNTIIKKFTIGAFLISIPLFFIFSLGVPYLFTIFAKTELRFWVSFVSVNGLVVLLARTLRKKNVL